MLLQHDRAPLILNQIEYCYRPQTKFAKVMFLQVSVCPQEGMHGCWGACMVVGGHAWLRGRGHVWLWGGHAWLWGACMVAGEGCVCGCGGDMHGM